MVLALRIIVASSRAKWCDLLSYSYTYIVYGNTVLLNVFNYGYNAECAAQYFYVLAFK
jgi:hypothetical protein